MKLIDLNILLYAVNSSAVHHPRIRAWWEEALNNEQPVGLAWSVVSGFLRLSTKPGLFPRPFTVEQAIERIDRWLRVPNVRLVTEQDEHWLHLKSLLSHAGTAGNLTTDAHLAALAISYGATLVSCDNDFARFEKLQWLNPLSHD